MSLTGPETSDNRRSGQAALKSELPFVLTAAIGNSEPFSVIQVVNTVFVSAIKARD